jgi:hypothetical protein
MPLVTRRQALLGSAALLPATCVPATPTSPEPVQEIDAEHIPRCPEMDGSTLRIVPDYTEAGWFCEANVITVTDGERTAIYVPLRAVRIPES